MGVYISTCDLMDLFYHIYHLYNTKLYNAYSDSDEFETFSEFVMLKLWLFCTCQANQRLISHILSNWVIWIEQLKEKSNK